MRAGAHCTRVGRVAHRGVLQFILLIFIHLVPVFIGCHIATCFLKILSFLTW